MSGKGKRMLAAIGEAIFAREADRKRKHADTMRAKMSPETRAKISAALTGRRHSAEARAKMAASHQGLTLSPETRAKVGAASAARRHSPETRAKMSATQKARWASGRGLTEEGREALRRSARQRPRRRADVESV